MDPVAEKNISDLAAAVEALPALRPVERARQAKALINRAKGVLSQARQGAIVEALGEGRTYAQLAAELHVSTAAINTAVTAQNLRMEATVRQKREDMLRGSRGVGPLIDRLTEAGTAGTPEITIDDDRSAAVDWTRG